MVINCCEENDLDGVTPCEPGDDKLAVVTIADDPEHAEEMKKRTECLADIG